ncbi:putative anterior fat body protein [Myriangium duriaei CBS 260.36]|uniref:Anterior fat body protein n=1 Tax=Myriangium duriaei CBS 260.36 TaxID=1168546 RepID=A0A9P4MIE3_9PEZI|nr:putative anterior fat body protein [Myriangium duriaei CBS 260.36]
MVVTAPPSADIKRYKITSPWLTPDTKLGEAPFWDSASNALRFVDIVRQYVYEVDLSKGPDSVRKLQMPASVSTTANIASSSKKDDDEFVFGGKGGVGVMRRGTGEWRYLVKYWGNRQGELEKKFRANDGAVDKRGRYFVSTMCDPLEGEIEREGTLFRLDPDLTLHTIKKNVSIPNGISWSLDDKFVYITESTDNAITKYPYNLDTGAIDWDAGKIFFQCPYEGGAPDGHARDAEGCFWICCFGTGKVVRVNEAGKIIAEVEVPTRCVTCPGICGEDLYITSAEEEEPDKHPQSVKLQGGVFKVHIGVKGAPLNEFVLDKAVR